MNLIREHVPDWESPAYHSGQRVIIRSRDLAGKWYVVYWYPLDFTSVCPTEIRGFQKLVHDFEDDDIVLIGASTDSFHCHQAWFADQKVFPDEVTHPILADTNHSVSKAFGVLNEKEGIAYRAVAIVDSGGRVRSISINDTDVGRSPGEVLRTVQAFQSGGLCGADWRKGEPFAG